MRHWTQEERERQSALIRNWKPWEQSTGPSTEAGKTPSAANAGKHGMRSTEWLAEQRRLKAILRKFQEAVMEVRA